MAQTTVSTTTNSNSNFLINYTNRDFQRLRNDLIDYIRTRHSDKFSYFNDASPDMMYLEMLSYTGDTLNYSSDKAFNEAFRESAQSRESLIRHAVDLGFYNYGAKPSTMQALVTISIPPVPNTNGSALILDPKYLVSLTPGTKIQAGNGTYFECLDEINFSDPTNRKVIPNYDTNNQLVDYTVQKTSVFIAGETKVKRFYVSTSNVKPFLEVLIDDVEVTEIIGVVDVPGNVYDVPDDSLFRDLDVSYVEVENLAQDKIFVEINPLPQDIQSLVNIYTDMTIHYGDYVNKPKRFIVRRDVNSNVTLTFGSTLIDYSNWNQLINTINIQDLTNFSLNQILNNMSLGEVPPVNSTLFIKYRSGAGSKTNVLANQTISVIEKQFVTASTAANLKILESVRNSLKIASNSPAVGGTDDMGNEDLRQSTGKIFSANDRAVTYEDVKSLIQKMPVRFGQPYRISYEEIKPGILSYSQIKGFLDKNLEELLNLETSIEREQKVQEIQTYINSLPDQVQSITSSGTNITLSENSTNLLNNAPSFWIGEKCRLHILGVDENTSPVTIYKDTNGIWQYPNELLKLNIRNWLREKRIIGDWIDIVDARVVNFQINFTILADKKNKQKVLVDCLTRLRDYFNITNWQINQPIFISNIITVLQEIDGVINVVDLKFYNIFDRDIETGRDYSPKEIGTYRNNKPVPLNTYNNKFEMNSVNSVILSYPDTFLSIKYPDSDIVGNAL